MLTVESTLGPIFLLILIGAALGANNFPSREFWSQAGRLVYYILFPALLVKDMAATSFDSTFAVAPVVVIFASTLFVAAILWLGRKRLTFDMAGFTSVFQGGIRFNTYVAIAASTALYGSNGAGLAAVVMAIMIPTLNILCVSGFVLTGTTKHGRWRDGLFEIMRNPLILACTVGVFLNLTGIGLPGVSKRILGLLAAGALPLALLTVGGALRLDRLRGIGRSFCLTSVVKLLVLPALALAVSSMFDLAPTARGVVLIFAAVPTASSAYLLALELGGDSELMAVIITGQTLLAVLTLPFWLYWVV